MTDEIINLKELTDLELLEKIYWARGYVSEQMFDELGRRLKQQHSELRPSSYAPSAERDPDVLMVEIKRLQRTQVTMRNQMAKIYKELKEKK